jgi:hypothetical protein
MEADKKRVNNYTSTSISKDKVPLLNELQKYVKEHHNTTVTHQHIIDLAVQLAHDDLKAFVQRLLKENNPKMQAYLKLQAELKAEGHL